MIAVLGGGWAEVTKGHFAPCSATCHIIGPTICHVLALLFSKVKRQQVIIIPTVFLVGRHLKFHRKTELDILLSDIIIAISVSTVLL